MPLTRSTWSATPILPKPFEDRFMFAAIKEYMNDTADEIEADLLSYPKKHKWKHKVATEKQVTAFWIPLRLQVVVEVHDDPYTYVDAGTKKHFIKPKNKKALHWGEGQGPDGKGFFSKGHMVKGIHARRWTYYVKKRWDKRLADTFAKMIADYAQRTGYAV